MKKAILYIILFALVPLLNAQSLTDYITFGDVASETAHKFDGVKSKIIKSAFDQSARVILKPDTAHWQGGKMSFTVKVDAEKQNYITVKFWGSDLTHNILILYVEGKQLGYRHLGDIDVLDIGDETPMCNNRFFYKTTPLPLSMTKGKTSVQIEIGATGTIWGYGTNFEQYQKNMDKDSRGIYAAYTHTDACFAPPTAEKQGLIPANPPLRKSPGDEILTTIKNRVNNEVDKRFKSTKVLNQQDIVFLAKAYHIKWSNAYHSKEVARLLVETGDDYCKKFSEDPDLVYKDKATFNPEWYGLGMLGNAIVMLENEVKPFLDKNIKNASGETVKRKDAWAEVFLEARDYLRTHRRWYTNQTMIIDWNIYLNNKALAIIAPEKAFTDDQAKRYLYEAVSLIPWTGIDKLEGGSEKKLGDNYWQLTAKGLTKELGYVGYYGEVLDLFANLYLSTCQVGKPETGDPKIKAQMEKAAEARAVFRYPALDNEGNKAMRIEATIGWRDTHLPGDVTYSERVGWDASPIFSIATSMNTAAIGIAQQMFDDNQFFVQLEDQLKKNTSLRVTMSVMNVPDHYELLKTQAKSTKRLPMTEGQPDFVFSDEEDGVVAIKNGKEVLYVSLYWRARNAINFLARVHHITPQYDRVANVYEDIIFEQNGTDTYKRPNWTNFGFGNGGIKYPVKTESAHTNEELPIAKIPSGTTYKKGDESIYAGKGLFYTLRYGNYLIAMNMSFDKEFELNVPSDFNNSAELVSKTNINSSQKIKIAAQKTVVLYKK